MRFAVPLAILAACQTLTMLTGGVDLSVAVVASMASYVMATNVSDVGLVRCRPHRRSSRPRWSASSTVSASGSSGSTR